MTQPLALLVVVAFWPAVIAMLVGFHARVAAGTVTLALVLARALGIGLWIPRARRYLIPCGVAFHVLVYASVPVTIFSALSCVLYLAYLDPDAVHRAIDRLSGAPPTS